MKELKEFTVEQLERLIHLAGVGCAVYESNTVAALAKIALAAKQAQIVAWEVKGIFCHTKEEASIYVGDPEPLYDAPPLNHTEQDGWIKCSERLPNIGQQVLAANRIINTFEVAIFDIGNVSGRNFFGSSNGKYVATHWMPLPAPPKPESE